MNVTDEPTIVDFWAEWCGPCASIVKSLDEIESEGKVKVIRVNVDEQPEIAQAFKVMSIPTLVLFEKKEEVRRVVGARSKSAIEADLGL